MKGIIFDIQHYAIYDGPGIRTTVFFKGCPLRCDWCHNPESQLLKPQMSYFAEKCVACGTCIDACTSDALKLINETVVRDLNKCNICGNCADVCPNQAMEQIGKEMTPDEIVENVLRDRIFYENSGGGVTISGGEATLQAEFLLETLKAFKKWVYILRWKHVAILGKSFLMSFLKLLTYSSLTSNTLTWNFTKSSLVSHLRLF